MHRNAIASVKHISRYIYKMLITKSKHHVHINVIVMIQKQEMAAGIAVQNETSRLIEIKDDSSTATIGHG